MRFKRAAVLAASLCLMGAIVSANSGSAAAEDAKARQPLGLQIIAIPSSIKGEEITSATLSGSGLLALGTAAGHLSIVDRNLRAWRGGWERRADPSAILGIAFSPDEAAIAAVTSDALVVWRLDDRTVVNIPVEVSPSAMALSPGGRWLAVTHSGVSVFDVSSQRLVREFEQDLDDGGAGDYEAVAFTPDAAVVAAASDENIDAWDIESGEKVQHWSCQCGASGVAFSADAALAVVGTTDAHALLWELASGQILKDKTMSTLEGDRVYGAAVSLKGTLVAAGTASGSVVVWDTGSGVIVARAEPSNQPISRITSSDDGQMLLVEGQKAEYVRGSYDRWIMTLTRR
jgi:WD40 repeat protein